MAEIVGDVRSEMALDRHLAGLLVDRHADLRQAEPLV